MSLGNLQNEGDLRRWFQNELRRPGVIPVPPNVALIKNGVPTDEDFPKPPLDGTTAVDETGPTLYCRIGGEWRVL
jgi:hypothetical protein